MSFFGRLLSHFFQDAAVNALANSKTFQSMAVKTVEAQKAVQEAMKAGADNPEAVKQAVVGGMGEFWKHLKAEIAKDVGRQQGVAVVPKKTPLS